MMPKFRKCRCGCGEPIPEGNTLRKAATIECSLKLARAAREKKERKELLADRARIKTRAQWAKEAQQAVNAYIRERDRLNGCISCGTHKDVQYAAGHFRTIGACPSLRFEPLNIHLQCNRYCNMAKSGNLLEYRIGLLAKIGPEKLAWLEGPHDAKQYTIDDLMGIKTLFTKMRKNLEMERL